MNPIKPVDTLINFNNPAALDLTFSQWFYHEELDSIFDIAENKIPDSISTTSLRIIKHYQAASYVQLGALNKAKKIFSQALELGENISLLRDISCCLYQLDEIDQWRKHYQRLAVVLHSHRMEIQTTTAWSCQLILGKFYEEEAHLTTAYEYYRGTLEELTEKKEQHFDLYAQTLTQMVRIEALMQNYDQVSQLYSDLITLDTTKLSEDLKFEIHHSLMIAELVLVGPLHSWERVKESFKNPHIIEQDLRLILFDYIEETLLSQQSLPEGVDDLLDESWQLTAHEEQIYEFFKNPQNVNLVWLNRLTPRLSSSCHIRGQILYLLQLKDPQLKKECFRKVQLLLGALPIEARSFWLQKMTPYSSEESSLTISVVRNLKKLHFQNQELDLSRKKGMLQIMNSLGEDSSVSINVLIEKLWNTTYTPEHFHRLRMTIHRLNRLLFDLTTVPKVVEFNSEEVRLNPNIHVEHTSV